MNRHTKAITLSLILALLATISHAATIRVPSEHLTIQFWSPMVRISAKEIAISVSRARL
jgi:hypothetical protein